MTYKLYRETGGTLKLLLGSGTDLTPSGSGDPTLYGSLPVGSASYTIPSSGDVFYVSPTGSDSAAGTLAAPWATLAKACASATAGCTIVFRAGTYNPGVIYTGQTDNNTKGYVAHAVNATNVTIQNYPGEAVWWDGSTTVPSTDFAADGTWWSKSYTPWRRDPQNSAWYTGTYPPPSNTWSVMDDAAGRPDWMYVDYSTNPTAAWPEIVWIDGIRCKQVLLLTSMVAGLSGTPTVFLDAYNNKLYLPVDPTGHTIRITNKQTLINDLGGGLWIKGIGIRRYGTIQPQGACIKFHRPGGGLENVWLEDVQATVVTSLRGTAAGAGGDNVTYRRVTVNRAGACGLSAHMISNLTIDNCVVTGSNIQGFKYAPASGGVKIDETYGWTLSNSIFVGNHCKDFWTDVDVQNGTVTNCDFINAEDYSFAWELSRNLKMYNCRFIGSNSHCITPFDSEDMELWNCTFANYGRTANSGAAWVINRQTDFRVPRESGYITYVDDRIPSVIGAWPTNPGGHMVTKTKLRNCILGPGNGGYFGDRNIGTINSDGHRDGLSTAAGLDVDYCWLNGSDGTKGTNRPYPWAVRDGSGTNRIRTNISVWRTLTAANACGQQDTHSTETLGTSTVNDAGYLQPGYTTSATATALALPSDVAALVGVTTGTQLMGCNPATGARPLLGNLTDTTAIRTALGITS